MKFLFILIFFSLPVIAQSLSNEEQQKLIEENRSLKLENEKLKEKMRAGSPDSSQIMEALKKGQKFQEEQLKALEELDQDL